MTNPIPEGHPTLVPNIVVEGGQEALDFYSRAFGGRVVLRLDMGDKLMHGEIQIGDSVLSVADPFPDYGFEAPESDTTSHSISIWVEDCDAVHAQAVAAGATEISAPADQFHGDRVGTLRCPFGHRWTIASRTREMTQEEMQQAMEAEFGGVKFADQEQWRAWLAAEHDRNPDGVWIEMAKKSSGIESITHPEAVEVALCFGWIDSQRKGVDDTWFTQRFTPRRARSKWSRLMREKAQELIASGAMEPAGLAEVERAKTDGRWDAAYEPPSTMAVPDDFRAALDEHPEAAAFFATLTGQARYSILHRIDDAKRPETRARRIAKYVAMCAAGEKLY